ncbi:MAG: alpha/beta hydrolase [Alphaproteobacteria bacterium]|nr:alpha/beta hydrolase [Alphaproteobacteria bacterium]
MNQETFFIKNRDGLRMSIRLTIGGGNLVFLLHGMSGNKDQTHMLVLEQEFARRGYTVVNLDTLDGHNEAESSPIGLTFTGMYNDLLDTIEWARGQEWFRGEPFALAGQSLGASIILYYAEENPADVNLLVLASLPWISWKSSDAQYVERFGPACMEKFKADGYYDKTSGNPLRVPYAYFVDLARYDFAPKARNITARTILIIGDMESQIRLDDNERLFELLKCEKELVILPGVGHELAGTPENEAKFRAAVRAAIA